MLSSDIDRSAPVLRPVASVVYNTIPHLGSPGFEIASDMGCFQK